MNGSESRRRGVLRRAGLAALAVAALAAALAPPLAVADPNKAFDPSKAREVFDEIANQDAEIQRGQLKALVNRLESKAVRTHDTMTLYLLARAYAKSSRTADAFATYAELIKADPNFPFAWRDRGVLHYERARELRKSASDPKTAPAAATAANAEADRAMREAESNFRQAIVVWPDYVDALQPLGVLLSFEAGKPKEAIPVLRRLVEVEPGKENARYQLAQAYGRAGQHDDGLRVIDTLLASAPTDPLLRELRAWLLAEKGDLKGSLAVYKALATESPGTMRPLQLAIVTIEKHAKTAKFDAADMEIVVWFLKRLRMLVPTDDERRKLTVEIDRIEASANKPEPGAAKPPTAEEIVKRIGAADPKERAYLLEMLSRMPNFPVTPDLIRVLVETLADATLEPRAREQALVLFEKFSPPGGFSLGTLFGGYVTIAMSDRDPSVRAKAAEVLGGFDSAAFVPAYLVLAAKSEDPKYLEAAAAARIAVCRIANVRPPFERDDPPAAQRAAFETWWKSPEAVPLKLRAIEDAKLAQDERPERGLILLATEPEPDVWIPAVKALAEVTARRNPRNPPPAARDAWLKSFPAIPADDLRKERREAVVDALLAWWNKAPK